MYLWESWLLCVDFCNLDRTLLGKAKTDFWTVEWMVGKGKADALSWVGFLYSLEDLGRNKEGTFFAWLSEMGHWACPAFELRIETPALLGSWSYQFSNWNLNHFSPESQGSGLRLKVLIIIDFPGSPSADLGTFLASTILWSNLFSIYLSTWLFICMIVYLAIYVWITLDVNSCIKFLHFNRNSIRNRFGKRESIYGI